MLNFDCFFLSGTTSQDPTSREKNLLIVLEEEEANPKEIEIRTVNRDTICSFITEYALPHVKSWAREESHIRAVVDLQPAANLKCLNHKKIVAIEFASFSDPVGVCKNYFLRKCDSPATKQIVEQVECIHSCLKKTSFFLFWSQYI